MRNECRCFRHARGSAVPDVDQTLQVLIEQARLAGPTDRIEYRDRIAAFGSNAIAPMATWLTDDKLGAFAVRVLGAIASLDDLSIRVLEAVTVEMNGIKSRAVARDCIDLAAKLQRSIDENRRIRAERDAQRIRSAQLARRAEVERQLSASRAERVTKTRRWLEERDATMITDAPLAADASLLVAYIDRLDAIRASFGVEPLNGRARTGAAESWSRLRLEPRESKREAVCWYCLSTVFSDLNPRCPMCGWLVCSCDACKEPTRFGPPCPRTVGRADASGFGL